MNFRTFVKFKKTHKNWLKLILNPNKNTKSFFDPFKIEIHQNPNQVRLGISGEIKYFHLNGITNRNCLSKLLPSKESPKYRKCFDQPWPWLVSSWSKFRSDANIVHQCSDDDLKSVHHRPRTTARRASHLFHYFCGLSDIIEPLHGWQAPPPLLSLPRFPRAHSTICICY